MKDYLSIPPPPTEEELEERRKKKESGLTSKALTRNIQRIGALVSSLPFAALGQGFESVIWWEDPMQSVATLVVFLYIVWKAPPSILLVALPAYLVHSMARNYVALKMEESSSSATPKKPNRRLTEVGDDDDDDDDDEADEEEQQRASIEEEASKLAAQDASKIEKKKPKKKQDDEDKEGILAKFRRLKRQLGEINDKIDGTLQTFERFQSALQWRDMTVSFILFVILVAVTLVLTFAPIRLLLMVGGTLRIMKYWLKTPDERERRFSTPNAVVNLIAHAPLPSELYLNEHSCSYEILKA